MRVEVLSATEFEGMWEGLPSWMSDYDISQDDIDYDDAEVITALSGRACYQSFDRPNPDTADVRDYNRINVLGKGHESVAEHASVTFAIAEVSRNLTHELIRHRHLSFSEVSQRYVSPYKNGMSYVVPPALRGKYGETKLAEHYAESLNLYDQVVQDLVQEGYSRKQAREAARYFLPSAQETRMVVTGNHRAWRHVIHLRNSDHADAEIQEFAGAVLGYMRRIAPSLYTDL